MAISGVDRDWESLSAFVVVSLAGKDAGADRFIGDFRESDQV